ncbi:hypothetical protein V8C35DRAFT_297717 [Trichoderma chlorosporum]
MTSYEAFLRNRLLNDGDINGLPATALLGPNFVHLGNHIVNINELAGRYIHMMTPETDWHHSFLGAAHQAVVFNLADPTKYRVVVLGHGGGLNPFADYGNNKLAPYIFPVAGKKLKYVIEHLAGNHTESFKSWLQERNPVVSWESTWMNLAAGAGGDAGVAANMSFQSQETLDRLDISRHLKITPENSSRFNQICKGRDLVGLMEFVAEAPPSTGKYLKGGLWDGDTKVSIVDSITGDTSYKKSMLAMGSQEASEYALNKIDQHLEIELPPKRLREKIDAAQKLGSKVLAESGRTFESIEEATAFLCSDEGVQAALEAIYQDAIKKYAPQITNDVVSKKFTLEDGNNPDAAMVKDFLKVATQEVYVAPVTIPDGDGEHLMRAVATDIVVEKIEGSVSGKAGYEAAVTKAEKSVADAKFKVEQGRKALKDAKDTAEDKAEIEKRKRELESAEREHAQLDKEYREKKSTKDSLDKSKEERKKEKDDRSSRFEERLKKRFIGTKKP